ncbi:hypothetical protein [Alteromonas halophila]|nr:hypothetical protein [Alteromonas halophila]
MSYIPMLANEVSLSHRAGYCEVGGPPCFAVGVVIGTYLNKL